jgi:hypothetical protein
VMIPSVIPDVATGVRNLDRCRWVPHNGCVSLLSLAG